MLRQISLYTMAVLFITTLFACSNDPNEPLTLSTVHPGEPQSETFATEIVVKDDVRSQAVVVTPNDDTRIANID